MKKNYLLFFTFLMNFQQFSYTWMATLKIMRHSSGHIIRLAGDIHAHELTYTQSTKKVITQEEIFLKAIGKSITNFLNTSQNETECFIIEKPINYLSLIKIINQYKDLLPQYTMLTIPLITQLNILSHAKTDPLIKLLISRIYKYDLKPKIRITPYDIRSKYPKLSELSFLDTQKGYNSYCQALIFYKNSFKTDIQKLINDDQKYKSEFRNFIVEKGHPLIKIIENETDLDYFFTSIFANFGYLTFIVRNTHKNITLYLGADHCHSLAQDLKKIGYHTIFKKGSYNEEDIYKNILPYPRSKKEYKTFFEIQ